MHSDAGPAWILPFSAIGPEDLPRVGGKGANLGVLARAGFPVPPGFAVTTAAFDAFLATVSGLDAAFASLDALLGDDVTAAREAASAMRALLGRQPVPLAIATALSEAWREAGPEAAYAVRSSATAEDLPGASFAGQQDTYLNVRGEAAIIDAVRRCWISLFTDRAVLYRARNSYGHKGIGLSVIVQRMVLPDAAGILFTADPVSGHRGVLTIDAGFGLGEALVSGLINADLYKVDKDTGAIREIVVGDKAMAIRPLPEGGTREEALPEALRRARVLDDAQVGELRHIGVAIEAHYGGVPQDVEWCLAEGRIFIVQARPITSLFPLPVKPRDTVPHVYLHFGHIQMMTDPISPMGRDVWKIIVPFGKTRRDWPESTAIVEAGGRLFIDPTPALRIEALRQRALGVLTHIYAPAAALLEQAMARPEFQGGEPFHATPGEALVALRFLSRILFRLLTTLLWAPTAGRAKLMDADVDALVAEANARITAAPEGAARVRACMLALSGVVPRFVPMIAPHLGAAILAQKRLARMVGDRVAPEDLESLGRGLEGNVTTEMDQQVADLADLVRPYPTLAQHLRSRPTEEALATLDQVPGGAGFRVALSAFLDRFGVRAAGEIDLARPRWREDPSLVLSAVLGNLVSQSAVSGDHRTRARAQLTEASAAIQRMEAAVSVGLFGGIRRRMVRRLAAVIRSSFALREHPKFALVRVLDVIRRVALVEGARLVAAGRLGSPEDVFQLHFPELLAAMEGDGADLRALLATRREERATDARRSPPLVMTSEGEILSPPRPRDLPPGALSGVAASAGVVLGLARVVRDPNTEMLHSGEILVAPFTDPGWTPLFVHAAGLVTEVGGLMTHGSVVAREYGIPAVVSVAEATTRIKTGDRIRVDGTRGIVEVLKG